MAESVEIDLSQLNRFAKQLAAVPDQVRLELSRGLYQQALIMFAESQRIVPVDTGTLARSGVVEPPNPSAAKPEVIIGYGGLARAYALVQHENLDYRHNAPEQAKYLEQPVLQGIPAMKADLNGRLLKILGGLK